MKKSQDANGITDFYDFDDFIVFFTLRKDVIHLASVMIELHRGAHL